MKATVHFHGDFVTCQILTFVATYDTLHHGDL